MKERGLCCSMVQKTVLTTSYYATKLTTEQENNTY